MKPQFHALLVLTLVFVAGCQTDSRVVPMAAGRLTMIQADPYGSHLIKIRLEGQPGSDHWLWRSTDLKDWIQVGNEPFTVPESGFIELMDTSPPPGSAFYISVEDSGAKGVLPELPAAGGLELPPFPTDP